MFAVTQQPDATVTAYEFLDVDPHAVWNGEFAELRKRPHHAIGRLASGCRIPQRKRRQSISMDVFGALLQLSKGGDGIARGGVLRVIHLDQDGAIPLDNEWIRRVVLHS